jgi:hypothetical protein
VFCSAFRTYLSKLTENDKTFPPCSKGTMDLSHTP